MRLLRAMFPLPENGVADVPSSFTSPKGLGQAFRRA
jgi:hypothetical protein